VEIAIIIEPHNGGYLARCRHPVEAEATGHSRHDARLALEAILRAHLTDPFTTLPLEATPDKPWVSFAGSIPDDQLTEEWLDQIAENRRRQDAVDQATLPPAPTAQPMP
jgi:hypothetical protein